MVEELILTVANFHTEVGFFLFCFLTFFPTHYSETEMNNKSKPAVPVNSLVLDLYSWDSLQQGCLNRLNMFLQILQKSLLKSRIEHHEDVIYVF